MNNLFVLYHKSCADGFAAAYVAWRRYGESANYIPCQYGDPVPSIPLDSNVFIVDFSFPPHILGPLADRCHALSVYDHHKSAVESLADFRHDASRLVLDTTRSGAAITWDEFNPGKPRPRLIEYIQDRDLWAWSLPQSREISAAISSYPYNFNTYHWLFHALESEFGFRQLTSEGAVILRERHEVIMRHANQATFITLGGYHVPIVNATSHNSEIGEELCRRHPECPFSVTFFVTKNGSYVFSLRSRNGFDCSAIAKQFPGGGGHPGAAGFSITPETALVQAMLSSRMENDSDVD